MLIKCVFCLVDSLLKNDSGIGINKYNISGCDTQEISERIVCVAAEDDKSHCWTLRQTTITAYKQQITLLSADLRTNSNYGVRIIHTVRKRQTALLIATPSP